MNSQNYTYEKKKCSKRGVASLGWWLGRGYVQEKLTVKYDAYVIIDPQGKKIAEAIGEKKANLICVALNGVEQ